MGNRASEYGITDLSGMIKRRNIELSEEKWVESELNCYYLLWSNRVTWSWFVHILRFSHVSWRNDRNPGYCEIEQRINSLSTQK